MGGEVERERCHCEDLANKECDLDVEK